MNCSLRQILILAFFLAQASGVRADERREWPFYLPSGVQVPDVEDSDAVANEVDAFIIAALARQGLKPAPEADRQTLIRRASYDLIGLPPTPEEVDSFLRDTAPGAWERVIERLLNDSRYGERWARYWLDLARYADTAGYEGDPDLPHAWRYRDYVIDSFNKDKPYDLFIKEQVAGDEFDEVMGAGDLPAPAPERSVALTFLRLAPFTEPRGDETRHEMLSEMTSTVSSVFLGLTVGCAKCHDHKYDDIPTRDFYRLKAFFATVSLARPEPGDGFQIGGPLPAAFYRNGEPQWAVEKQTEFEREISESKTKLAELTKQLTEKLGGNAGFGIQAHGGPLGNDYYFDQTRVHDGELHTSIINCNGQSWSFFTDGQGPGETGNLSGGNRGQWYGDIPAIKHVALGQYSEGTGGIKVEGAHHVGEFAQVLIFDHPLSGAERRSLAAWISMKLAAENAAVEAPPIEGLRFWLDASDLDADASTPNPADGKPVAAWTDRVNGITIAQSNAELQPTVGRVKPAAADENALGAPAVSFADGFLVGPAGDIALAADQQGSLVAVYTARHSHEGYAFEIGGDSVYLSTFINPSAGGKQNLEAIVNNAKDARISTEERDQYRFLASRERFLQQHIKRLRPVAMSLRHSYGPPYEPGVPTSRVMIRGEYDNPGEVVVPGFPTCVEGEERPARIRLDPFKRWPTRSRRMTLANWIASPNNPLTARVIVNRLWHWHFGRGIVATPSDFGVLSGGPSHPKLLDWLAERFIKDQWSLKAAHRVVMCSRTYRQTSAWQKPDAELVDPENTLLWRFNRRRLDAESVRDGILAVSGRLNPEQFGLPIFPPLPGDIEERVKYTRSKWDTQRGPEGRKRSIYIYQQRTLTMPFLQVFDALVCDESRPRRQHSTTPLQALAMYNGAFVNDEAVAFAERVRSEAGGDSDDQVTHAFRLALGRAPDATEVVRMRVLLDAVEPGGDAIAAVCRVLFNSNEFLYVD